MLLGTACWTLTDCFRAAGSQSVPLPLDPLLAPEAGPPGPPARAAPGPQLLPEGLEWKGSGTVIWSREFSGDRLDPSFSGCYAGVPPTCRTGKADLPGACEWTQQTLPVKPGKGCGPPPSATEGPPRASPLSHPLPPSHTGALGLEPILPWNKQCVLRNHTQACDIYGYGVNESICLSTNVWAPAGLWGVGGDSCHGAHGPLLGSRATSL